VCMCVCVCEREREKERERQRRGGWRGTTVCVYVCIFFCFGLVMLTSSLTKCKILKLYHIYKHKNYHILIGHMTLTCRTMFCV
jgi:hypothetical protein